MEFSSVIVLVANFLLIAILPRIFFRRDGKLTLMWLLTALPYAAGPIISICVYTEILPSLWSSNGVDYQITSGFGLILCLFSIMLIGMTIGTHRVPLALWHQNQSDDEPKHIVTWGAYKHIRHPFYTSFILTHIANCIIAPHWGSFLILIYTLVLLDLTAKKEEKRLSNEADGMGLEYRNYMMTTGRFFPRFISNTQVKVTN